MLFVFLSQNFLSSKKLFYSARISPMLKDLVIDVHYHCSRKPDGQTQCEVDFNGEKFVCTVTPEDKIVCHPASEKVTV